MNYCLLDGSLLIETRDPEQTVVNTAYLPSPAPPQKKPLILRLAIYSILIFGVGFAIVAIISKFVDQTPDSSSTQPVVQTPTPYPSATPTLSPEPAQSITPRVEQTPAYSPTPYDTPVATPSTTATFPTPSSTTTTTGGNYSEAEKHRLFQAVGITRDNALIVEVAEKIGVSDSRGNPNSNFESFVKEHMNWARANASWVQE